MKMYCKYALLSAVALALVLPGVSFATNGMFLIGYGTKSRAMGGTGVAYNMDGMAAAFNPATLVDSVDEFDIGAELFHPPRAVYHNSDVLGQTNTRSLKDWFLIPSMGGAYNYSDDITLGFAVVGAGLQTSYAQSDADAPTMFNANLIGDAASGEAGVELMQMQMLPSIAYKLDDTNSVGATMVMAAQYFRAEGLGDFVVLGFGNTAPGDGDNGLTNEGWDYSFGAGIRLGWLGKYMDGDLNVGVNYSSRVYMSKFHRYNNLFAEGGDFDIPENFAVGIAYKVMPDVTVAFDVQRVMYEDIDSIGNKGPLALNPTQFFPLCPVDPTPCLTGGDKGLGFGWENQTIFKLGADWNYSEKINIRGGINYGKAPIPEDQVLFNMLAPATPELHVTFGANYLYSKDYEFSFNFMHAFQNTIKGPTAFGPNGGQIVTGTNASIAMEQYSLGFGLAIKF
ncbi:MAG: outer membrane protein transport protein [Gammaproteobacteria bacterium]|nr:outer membrane protein transport protein [Gammaproteobacteria bacterium]